MNLPAGYEPFRVNTIANDAVVGILCRRPDGGVSDVRAVLPNPTTYGVCPSCGRDMKAGANAVFSCKAGHVLVVQTTPATTARFVGKPRTRTVKHVSRSGSFPARSAVRPVAQTKQMSDEDLRAVVENAMKEAGF